MTHTCSAQVVVAAQLRGGAPYIGMLGLPRTALHTQKGPPCLAAAGAESDLGAAAWHLESQLAWWAASRWLGLTYPQLGLGGHTPRSQKQRTSSPAAQCREYW